MKEEIIKARYRNKVGKIIIEVWNGEKWIYVKTLSNPLVEFKAECLAKVSLNQPKIDQNNVQKCEQSILSEPVKQDTITPDIAKDELNKLMKNIL